MALNENQRKRIEALWLVDNTITNIAKEIGCSYNTAKKHVLRLKKQGIDKSAKIAKLQNTPTKSKTNRPGRPLLFSSVEELETKIEAYFKSCWDYKRDMFGGRLEDKVHTGEVKNGKKQWEHIGYIMEQVRPYTVSGLAVYLKTSRETLMNYEKKEAYFDTIKCAKDRIYAYVEERLFTSRPTGPIFSLKNNYGWKDKHVREDNINVDNNIGKIIDLMSEAKNEGIIPQDEIKEFKKEEAHD